VEKLRGVGMLDCLRLLHFHIGSQVSAIRSFKDALKEGARVYVELSKLGAPLGYFDVGGGLGVDYDGSSSNFASSVNYSVQEYAYDVVASISAACNEAEVPHPDIVTESGRAMVAHHAILVVNVLGVSEHPSQNEPITPEEDDPDVMRELHEATSNITKKTFQAAWHDAVSAREQLLNMFTLGLIDIKQRARGERMFWQCAGRIAKVIRGLPYVPDEFEGLIRSLADTYFCNFSVFQSIPDSWAVDQLFPVVPIHRLEEKPTRQGVLADITCDSDGKVDHFIDLHDVKDTLELHAPNGQPYLLGVFLVGAYQEILGDLHNLFGDTHSVQVSIQGPGLYHLDSVVEGDTVTDVLNYVQFNRRDLVIQVRRACEQAVKSGQMTIEESTKLLSTYQRGLEGYTYLE
jgi:arginine decarboxylase